MARRDGGGLGGRADADMDELGADLVEEHVDHVLGADGAERRQAYTKGRPVKPA